MHAEALSGEGYYDKFDYAGWDLQLMLAALKGMSLLHNGTFDRLREQPSANVLVVGSATPRNIDNMALMDWELRPGLGTQDVVYIIDYNHYPLQKHQSRIDFLAEWDQTSGSALPDGAVVLPYPSVRLAQADMMRLPFRDGAMSIVVSDYTLNFADSKEGVEQTVSGISRVLSDGGFFFMSVRGDPDFPYTTGDVPDVESAVMRQNALNGDVTINQLPLATYVGIAQNCGLRLIGRDAGPRDTELLCAVFQKAPPGAAGPTSQI